MKSRIMTTLFCSIVALCIGIPAAAQESAPGVLKGRVVDEKGKPIAGAEVRLFRSRDRSVQETTTDASGNYRIELQPDEYVVSFEAEGFQGGSLREMQQVESGKESRVKTVTLPRARKSSLIRGVVFDSEGRSLPGARIKLLRLEPEQGKGKSKQKPFSMDYVSNSRGEFAFRVPSEFARYELTATLRGYRPQTRTVSVSEHEAVAVAFNLEAVER